MTPTQLQSYRDAATAAKARADKATPGPWTWKYIDDSRYWARDLWGTPHPVLGVNEEVRSEHDRTQFIDGYPKDFDFIAAARTDIPTLADAVIALAAEVERLTGENKRPEDKIAALQGDEGP